MNLRPLGRTGLQVSPLCLGGNVFGWTADRDTSFALLDRFVDGGGNFIDTADSYSRWVPGHAGGESETIIGEWLARGGRRDRVVIATKVGSDMGQGRKDLRASWIRRAVEDSLRRLRIEAIDLYQAHWDDQATPQEETLGAFADLVRAGKVRAIGCSNHDAARLGSALAISDRLGLPRYATLQPHFNLVDRSGYAGALEDLCRREGLGVIPYYSLASGFLTGKYRDPAQAEGKARGRSVAKYLDAAGLALLGLLDRVAAAHGATPAQVALAWLMARPGITAPIASATSTAQLDELLGAMRLALDPAAIAELDAAQRPPQSS
ncbi:aldo/keto reductase [Falsiroseomonas sp. CW058]|uniref:aldo/keto reductase n=1 Tax=Falsiroseomonas sp. CW058 TaxID=3388664 RepID=UPI003D312288